MGRCFEQRTLSEYLDGELAMCASEHVRSHLAECEKCSRVLADLQETEAVVKRYGRLNGEVPDLAARVTEELRQRGEFVWARAAARRRKLFGEHAMSLRIIGAAALAAVILLAAFVGLDQASRRAWAARTDPVLADAERVLIRLTLVDPRADEEALAKAREEAREYEIPTRLAEVRSGVGAGLVEDFACLQSTFSLLVEGRPLPPELAASLAQGDLLKKTEHLRGSL